VITSYWLQQGGMQVVVESHVGELHRYLPFQGPLISPSPSPSFHPHFTLTLTLTLTLNIPSFHPHPHPHK
jgi:hypothetical protein